MILRRLLFGAACPLFTVALLPGCGVAASTSVDLCAFTPVFMEEFDSQSIAPRRLGGARWTAHTPWNGDFGDATFVDPGPIGPFAVADGILSITARKGTDGRWRSGLIAAADGTGVGEAVQYGYFETRMKMPPGPGTWPAFWLGTLRPAGDPGPGLEIDAVEYYGHSTDAFSSAVHVWYKDGPSSRHESHKTTVPDGSLVADFHTYGVEIDPEHVTFYFDRKSTWQVPTPPELHKPMYPLVNLALGSGFPIDRTPDPSVLLVDYVHVYARTKPGEKTSCAGSSPQPQ